MKQNWGQRGAATCSKNALYRIEKETNKDISQRRSRYDSPLEGNAPAVQESNLILLISRK